MSKVVFKSYERKVLSQMQQNIQRALTALGQAIVEVTVDYMQYKYGKAIYLTGDLIRSITFNIDIQGQRVTVGSNLNYAVWVHNGTARMPARPFLKDAILENINIWEEVVAEHLGEGWTVKAVA